MTKARLTFRFLVVAAALAAVVPASAQGADAFTLGPGHAPHLLVDPDGTLHATWVLDDTHIRYCRVARGTTAGPCSAPVDLTIPPNPQGANVSQPFLLRGPGNELLIETTRYVGGDAWLWTSSDNGATWSAARKIYDAPTGTDFTDPILGPRPGEITVFTWNPGRVVFGAQIDGSEREQDRTVNLPREGIVGPSTYDLAGASTGDNGLIAVAHDIGSTHWWRLNPGGDPSNQSDWSGPSLLQVGAANSRVAGGNGVPYVLTQTTERPISLQVRKWNGAGFDPPKDVTSPVGAITSDITVGPSGAVGVAWRQNTTPGPQALRVAIAPDGNLNFGRTVTFAEPDGVGGNLDVGLAQDGQGWAIWEVREGVRVATLAPLDPPGIPIVGSLILDDSAFRAARTGDSVVGAGRGGRRAPVGTIVSFRLSEDAVTTFTVERATRGRRVGRRCVRQTSRNRGRRACTRYVRQRGSFTVEGVEGNNQFRFTGRLRNRRLAAGSYRLVSVARDVGGNRSTAKRTRFRIVR